MCGRWRKDAGESRIPWQRPWQGVVAGRWSKRIVGYCSFDFGVDTGALDLEVVSDCSLNPCGL